MGKHIKVNEWMVEWMDYYSHIINKMIRFFSYERICMICIYFIKEKREEGTKGGRQ